MRAAPAALAVLLALALLLASSPPAAAEAGAASSCAPTVLNGFPTLNGEWTPGGDLVAVGYLLLGFWYWADECSAAYADVLTLIVLHAAPYPETLRVGIHQYLPVTVQVQENVTVGNTTTHATVDRVVATENEWSNVSFQLAPQSVAYLDLPLPATPAPPAFDLRAWGGEVPGYARRVLLDVGGLPMAFVHESLPTSFLLGPLTVEGVLGVFLAATAETLLLIAAFLAFFRWGVRKRAYRAPDVTRRTVGIWAAATIAVGIHFLAFYPEWDLFLGAAPFWLIPVPLALLFAVVHAPTYNLPGRTIVLSPDLKRDASRMTIRKWTWDFAVDGDGQLRLCDPRWRGFLYAVLLGVGPPVVTRPPRTAHDALEGPPFFARLEEAPPYAIEPPQVDVTWTRRRLFDRVWVKGRRGAMKARRRWAPGRRTYRYRTRLPGAVAKDDGVPLTREDLWRIGDVDDATQLAWVDWDRGVQVAFARLAIHRAKPARAKDGTPLRDPETEAAQYDRKLTLPYVVQPKAIVHFAGIHFAHQVRVIMGEKTLTDVTRSFEAAMEMVYALEADAERQKEARAMDVAKEVHWLRNRGRTVETSEEAHAAVAAWRKTAREESDEAHAEAQRQATAKAEEEAKDGRGRASRRSE